MSKKIHRKKAKPTTRQLPWLWIALAGTLLVIVGGLALVWQSSNQTPAEPPEVTGAPSLKVDRPEIDEGDRKLRVPVRTVFHLKNVGDHTLNILGEPQVQVVEGC